MPLRFYHHIRKQASQMACNSMLYNWSLGGDVPESLLFKPADLWPGDADAGRAIMNGAFLFHGDTVPLQNAFSLYSQDGSLSPMWLGYSHGFEWLRDLRALGGDNARECGRILTQNWMSDFSKWDPLIWGTEILAPRICAWITNYDYFFGAATEEVQHHVLDLLLRQVKHLQRSIDKEGEGLTRLVMGKALLYAGLVFEGREGLAELGLDILEEETHAQILGDGSHISRNPAAIMHSMQILIDVRAAMAAAKYPLPESIQHAIDRAGPALRFFRQSDKHLSCMNGAREDKESLIESILSQANVRGRSLKALPSAGYERLALGKSVVMIDCGNTPFSPHDKNHHAAPLAFEFMHGKERVIVSCGSHPTSAQWKDSLRATAAHSTLTIDNRNACEIHEKGGISRGAKNIVHMRQDSANACLFEGSHDAYIPLNGITHGRKFYLANQGDDLRGEESLSCMSGITHAHEVALRFHLHPGVPVSLIQNGEAALLRLSNGTGWRFCLSGGTLRLEDSIYLGEGIRPRKTKQLVIYSVMDSDHLQIKWALQRERL